MISTDAASSIYTELDQLSIDWSDFEQGAAASRALAVRIGTDGQALRDLVYGLEQQSALLEKAERHHLLDYLVLYDALDRGFRIRLHKSTNYHLERPHDHRFAFSSYIICGAYEHHLHLLEPNPYVEKSAAVKTYMSLDHPDPGERIQGSNIRTILSRRESAGCSYTLDHTAVHTTITTPDTFSVFVRGPSMKDRSLIYDCDTKEYWWRFGQAEEPEERRRAKRMSYTDYLWFREQAEQLHVFSPPIESR